MSHGKGDLMDSWRTTFLPTDTLKQRLKKAAHVSPSPAQLKWMERGYIAFLHYSPNTFTNRQWGNGTETPEDFCPDRQSPAQWARVCREAGMRMVIPTLKHHDGFCQWHTDTTPFSTAACADTTDIARALSEACAREGIDFGVYLSPWDMNLREKGIWPTEAYQQVYMKQLRELMTRYGAIGELWLDGACGDRPIWQAVEAYRPDAWYDLMEQEQPDCVVRRYDPFCFATEQEWEAFRQGQGELRWRGKAVRWVGNEDGVGRTDEWSVQPVFHRELGSDATLPDLGQEHYYPEAVGAVWYPNEVNTHLLNQWFWNEETSYVRPLEELVNIFYHSIGNNGTLLLNVSPDRHGLIPEDQIRRLREFREFMEGTFGTDLAQGASAVADSEMPGTVAQSVLSEEPNAWWSPACEDWDVDRDHASLEIVLPEKRTFDNLLIQENIRQGQRVAGWQAYAWVDGQWMRIAGKKTIGYKTIVRFPAVTTDRVRVDILRSWDTPQIARISLHRTYMPETEDLRPHAPKAISALPEEPAGLSEGLRYTVYQGGMQSAAMVGATDRPVLHTGITAALAIPEDCPAQDYSLLVEGYLRVPYAHEALFKLGSADGAVLWLNSQRVLDNDEPHDYAEQIAAVQLEKGVYHVKLQYTSFRHPGQLRVLWTNPAYEFVPIPGHALAHTAE